MRSKTDLAQLSKIAEAIENDPTIVRKYSKRKNLIHFYLNLMPRIQMRFGIMLLSAQAGGTHRQRLLLLRKH
jgi:hypothetical protein